MKKFWTLLLILIIAPLIAGLYGIVHDQITYTISHEYYTKFKFIQFGVMAIGVENGFPMPRLAVAIVGFGATWWMGLPIGIILGLVGLIHRDSKTMFSITMKAFIITMITAFITGIIGLLYGEFYLSLKPREYFINWFLPDNIDDFKNYISVGSMHNCSYFGGLIGLITGIFYSFRMKKKLALKPGIKKKG